MFISFVGLVIFSFAIGAGITPTLGFAIFGAGLMLGDWKQL